MKEEEWEPKPGEGICLAGEEFQKLQAEHGKRLEKLAMEDLAEISPLVTRLKKFIQEKKDQDLIPALRNKTFEFPEVQYARGALDALDSLLEFLEENQ